MKKSYIFTSSTIALLSATTILQSAYANLVTIESDDAPSFSITTDQDNRGSNDGSAAVIFDTSDTEIEAHITNDADIYGDDQGLAVDLSTNENDDVTLVIFSGSTVSGGDGDAGSSGGGNGSSGNIGIRSGNNEGLTITVRSGAEVSGGSGGAGGDNSSGSGGSGGSGENAIIFDGDTTGALNILGNVLGGDGAVGGNSTGANGNGGSGGSGAVAIHFDGGSALTVTNGQVTGGSGGAGGSGHGTGSSGDGGIGSAAVTVEASGATVTIEDGGALLGGNGGNYVDGGDGLIIRESGTVNVTSGASITGGDGGVGSSIIDAGSGGEGIRASDDGTFVLNVSGSGTLIQGGDGGAGGSSSSGGRGGDGVRITDGSATITVGVGSTIMGGSGGELFSSEVVSGADGIKITDDADTLTLVNSGVISSGAYGGEDDAEADGIELDEGSGHSITNNGTIRTLGGGSAIDVKSDTVLILNNADAVIEGSLADDGGRGISTDDDDITIDALTNHGTIRAIDEDAIFIDSSDTVTALTNTGLIENTNSGNGSDSSDALQINGTVTTLSNSGTIRSSTSNALYLDDGSVTTLTNSATGVITGTATSTSSGAIYISGSTEIETFNNAGTISYAPDGEAAIYFDDDDGDGEEGQIGVLNNTGEITAAGSGGFAIENDDVNGDSGVIRLDNSGTITGHILQRSDQAYVINQTDGTITGDVTLDSRTGNDINISGGTIDGSVSMGTGSADSTFDITGGDITGSVSLAGTASTLNVNLASSVTSTIVTDSEAVLNGTATQLVKDGDGILIFGGDILDSDTGSSATLDVNDGIVRLTKSATTVEGNVEVDSGATLDIDDNDVSINAASSLAASSNLEFKIDGSESGTLTLENSVDANVTVTDNANIVIDDASIAIGGSTYVVVDATGAGGGSNLTVDASNLNLVENLVRHDFTLQKIEDQLVLVVATDNTGVSGSNREINQQIDTGLGGDSEIIVALNGLTTASDVDDALTTLSPDKSGGSVNGTLQIQDGVITTVENRVSSLEKGTFSGISSGDNSDATPGFWGQIFGQVADQDDDGGLSGYSVRSGGIATGFDRTWSDTDGNDTVFGVAYAYGVGKVEVNNSHDETDISSHQTLFYSRVERDRMVYDAQLSFAFNEYDSTRNVVVGAVNRVAEGNYNGIQYGANARAGYKYNFANDWQVTPSAGVRYLHLSLEDYTEEGAAAANLNVLAQDYSVFYGILGAELEKKFTMRNGYTFVPELRASYSYDFINDDIETTAQFSGGGSSFKTYGIRPERHTYSVGVGAKVAKGEGLELSVNYDQDFRDNYHAHNGMINLRYDF